MSIDVQTEIVIDRPRAAVAAYASHPENAPEWYANIDTVEWKTPPAMAIGSKAAFVARFLGRKMAYTYEIVEYEPGHRLKMRSSDGPFEMETTYQFDSLATDRTRVVLGNRGGPTGFAKLMTPLMVGAMRRANTRDLALLKQIVEKRVDPHPGP